MQDISTYYLTQGVLGVTVLVLVYVVIKLYSKIERLETEKVALMDARRLDALQTLEKVNEVMSTNSQTNRLLAEKIEGAKQSSRGNV